MHTLHFWGRGARHEERGEACQDRLSVFTAPNGTTILALSDGCSSSKFGGEAAEANVLTINNIFSKIKISELSRDALIKVYPELKAELSALGDREISSCFKIIFTHELRSACRRLSFSEVKTVDVCATLLFAVCEREKTLVGHIGDGGIICYDDKGNVTFYSEEENGKDSSHTYFTVSSDFQQHFRLDTISSESYSNIIMFSDGPFTMLNEREETVTEAAYESLVGPYAEGKIQTYSDLEQAVQECIAPAMHYIFDDWSLILAKKEPAKLPISLDALFTEIFERQRGIASVEPLASQDQIHENQAKPSANPQPILWSFESQAALYEAARVSRIQEALINYNCQKRKNCQLKNCVKLNDFCSICEVADENKVFALFVLDSAVGENTKGRDRRYRDLFEEQKRMAVCGECPDILQVTDWFDFFTNFKQTEAVALRFYKKHQTARDYFEQNPADLQALVRMLCATSRAMDFCSNNGVFFELSLGKIFVTEDGRFVVSSINLDQLKKRVDSLQPENQKTGLNRPPRLLKKRDPRATVCSISAIAREVLSRCNGGDPRVYADLQTILNRADQYKKIQAFYED
ncbi:MAG: protein phosphatase 2C domain-containing protein, partial [Clostridia bacterium]|nr:protein phosphatase 2C domain-containing protein [Clostridia bacterium]